MLDDHLLDFPRHSPVRNCAVASITPASGETVWGALYYMAAHDLAALDAREGHSPDRDPSHSRYHRCNIVVQRLDGAAVEAVTYVANPSPDPGLPSPEYVAHLIDGALHHRFPEVYIAMLRRLPTLEIA